MLVVDLSGHFPAYSRRVRGRNRVLKGRLAGLVAADRAVVGHPDPGLVVGWDHNFVVRSGGRGSE